MTVLDAGAVAGFPCTLARGVVRWDCVCVYLCAPGFVNGVWWCVRVARFVSGGCFTTCVEVCPLGCLFVGCALLCRVLLVCCGLFCLSAIVWCAFRECSRSYCGVVHAGLCGCAFDGDLGCRLLFTV